MAELAERPFPPGSYPLIVVGSGPGGLQTTYFLRKLGIQHAVISADPAPAGMFRKFPFFERLITWTKPYATAARGTRTYEWYDWNTLLAEDPSERAEVAEFMDGTSYFPSRSEMEKAIVAFSERNRLQVRFDCRWQATRHEGDEFVLETTDGEYRSKLIIFAIGVTQPWRDSAIEGVEAAPHYMEIKDPKEYADKRVFIIGKGNAGFETADALLPWARKIFIASPSPVRMSVLTHSTDATRARYMQPVEDHALGGGNLLLDATIPRIERTSVGYRVHAEGTTIPGKWNFDVEEVVVATGVSTPMLDLADIGVAGFWRGGRLPRLTPFWESPTVPGIYFAGNASMGAVGLKKYGIPSNSAAAHGYRYNARVLTTHIARTHFGIEPKRRSFRPEEVVPFLLDEATNAPELWNQQSYLARVLSVDKQKGILDEGILPLHHVVDAGPDSVAIAVETDDKGEIHPVVYIDQAGHVDEFVLAPNPLLKFDTGDHQAQLSSLLAKFIG